MESGERCGAEPAGDLPGRWFRMITPVKAWDLISVGDQVYIHDEGGVVAVTVRKVDLDHLLVDGGFLYYADHGEEWWLTKIGAKEKWHERN